MWMTVEVSNHHSLSTSTRQDSQKVRIVLFHLRERCSQLVHFTAGVQNGGVVTPTERFTDLGKTVTREFFAERHRELPRSRDGTAATFRQQFRDTDLEVLCARLLHGLDPVSYTHLTLPT